MIFYLLPATVVCAICLHALSQDADASMTDMKNWGFILLAAAIWPVTLPSILVKKYQQWNTRYLKSANC
ncbi:MAG: hypothetical protein AAFY20_26360 [Cyanobacteria bacterium J06639_14]